MLGLARLSGQTFGATIAALVFKLYPHHGQMPVAMSLACGLAVIGMGLSFLRLRVSAPATEQTSGSLRIINPKQG
jgi:DHA2 family multidrug resistance protein-like MFS transporter